MIGVSGGLTGGAAVRRAQATDLVTRPIESNTPFRLYIAFTVATFLSLWNWVPALKPLRLTVLLIFVICVSLFLNREYLAGRMKSDISRRLFMLLGYIAVSLPFIVWPGSVLRQNIDEFGKAIAFFFFTVLIVDTPRRLKIFAGTFLGCQLVRSIEPVRLHVFEGYWGSDTFIGSGEFMGRLSSAPWDTVNPNGYAFVIATAFVFAHHLMLGSRSRIWQLLYLAILPLLMYGMILSSSRSGMIALAVAVVAIFLQSKKRTMMLVAAVVGIGVATSTMTDLQKERYLSLVRSDVRGSATATGRVEGAKEEVIVWLKHPIFGTGLGTSAEAKYNAVGYFKISHNMYLEALIELGIIGFAIFVSILVAIWRTARQALKQGAARARQTADVLDDYSVRLGKTLQAWFPMCAVFSVAHYGVSEPYWYLFAGLAVAWSRCARVELRPSSSDEPKTAYA